MTAPYNKPLPKIDALTRPFWDHARQGKLAMQVCDDCADVHFPPTPVCPACLSDHQSWQIVSGDGVLESWIDLHRAYWPGFTDDLPYRVCIVKLAEGPLLASNLVGPSEDAKLHALVRVTFEQVTDEITLPKFKLVDG
jgi:uncharacterized OB-fold protein